MSQHDIDAAAETPQTRAREKRSWTTGIVTCDETHILSF
jgi:hypothetical protein